MWIILLLLPTLLFADVDPSDAPNPTVQTDATVTDAPVNAKEAPATNDVARTALPNVSAPISTPVSATAATVELHLKPTAKSPVVLTLPASEAQASAQDAGVVADGQKWMSVEHAVTLVGYVDKANIDKDLTVEKGTTVWSSPDKAEQLTVVDNPESVRLLEVDHLGKVEVKEPRVLYYTNSTQPVAATPPPAPQKAMDNMSQRRGTSNEPIVESNLRPVEGILRKGNPLFGRKLFLYDQQGQMICRIDPSSPIDWMTFTQYIGHTAVYVGEMHQNGDTLVLTVHSIRMR